MEPMRGRRTGAAGHEAGAGAPPDEAAEDPADGVGPQVLGWRWLRRIGVVLVLATAALPVGLQLQLRDVRDEVVRAEAADVDALGDVREAAHRVRSVDERVVAAEGEEDAAQAELDRARAVLAAVGLRESTMEDVQVETGSLRDAYRTQYDGETAAIADQERVEPAAEACLLDRVRALARVAVGHQPGAPSAECTTVAGRRPSAG